MPRPKALSPNEAKRTLVHRFGPRVNRLRQIAVRFGLRPYRVWLVWFEWTGDQVGEGVEREFYREEILPTPEFTDNTRFLFLSAGATTEGEFMLRRVDPTLGELLLSGNLTPGTISGSPCPDERGGTGPVTFQILVREDGRSGDEEDLIHRWFTLSKEPFRKAGQLDWDIRLTRVDRQGT